ncbi:MAG TPA: hypothetical protein VG917_00315 [Patescibacteria group bacterium]|nr:hypothetical protein [Patescibacteria group bacterium]
MVIVNIIILALTIFICFFLLFLTSKQDFVLLRQNISLNEIFDLSAISFLIAFFFGRALFIASDFKFEMIGFVKFFHLLKFPGMSPLGFFLGAGLSIYLFFRKKKGLGRIYDIFSISFFPLFILLSVDRVYPAKVYFAPFIIAVILLLIFAFFIKSHQKYILKDGSISYLFIMLISLDTLISQFFLSSHRIILNLSILQILSIPLISSACVLLFVNQKTSKK